MKRFAASAGFWLVKLAGYEAMSRRRAGPLRLVENEWAPLVKPTGPAANVLVDLVLDVVNDIRAAEQSPILEPRLETGDLAVWPGEHYRLLTSLADCWSATRVVEIGTFEGASALAFLASSTVHSIQSFDITPWDVFPNTLLRKSDFDGRLEQSIADLSDAGVFSQYVGSLLAADLIFFDGPKDGRFEAVVLRYLLAEKPSRAQLLVFDDIRLSPMVELWNDIQLPKLDITSLGHWSGTGLVFREP